jgi:hypothetical protein
MTKTLLVACGRAQFHQVPVEIGPDDPRSILLAAQVTFDHYPSLAPRRQANTDKS